MTQTMKTQQSDWHRDVPVWKNPFDMEHVFCDPVNLSILVLCVVLLPLLLLGIAGHELFCPFAFDG